MGASRRSEASPPLTFTVSVRTFVSSVVLSSSGSATYPGARKSFAHRSFRTLLLSLVPVSRKLSSHSARLLLVLAGPSSSPCSLKATASLSSSPLTTVLWCDANASHQARSVLFASGHIIVTAPATHCTQRSADAWGSDHPTHPRPDPHPSLQPRSTLVN